MAQPDLLAFQSAMKSHILGQSAGADLTDMLGAGGDIPAIQRLQIHRNNYKQSLVSALGNIFPATKAFVGAAFIEGALGEFVLAHPPKGASLAEYGADFSVFFANHRASKSLPYIVDLLRLEWALHNLQSQDESLVDVAASSNLPAYQLSPNAIVIDSNYPLMSLWSVATGQIPPEAVHLEQGGQSVVAIIISGEIRLIALNSDEAECLKAIRDNTWQQQETAALAVKGLINKRIIIAA